MKKKKYTFAPFPGSRTYESFVDNAVAESGTKRQAGRRRPLTRISRGKSLACMSKSCKAYVPNLIRTKQKCLVKKSRIVD